MKHNIALAAGLIPFAVAAMGPAQAQVIYVGPPRVYMAPMVAPAMPPGEALALVRASGFTPLTRPARRGPRYLLLASDRAGGQVRVVMNAYNGRIVRVEPAYDPRFAYHPVRPPGSIPVPRTRVSELPPAQSDRQEPRASRDAGPDITGSLPPHPSARTPLPRPRPATASNNATLAKAPPTEAAPSPAANPAPAAAPAASPPANAATPKPVETQLVPVAPLD